MVSFLLIITVLMLTFDNRISPFMQLCIALVMTTVIGCLGYCYEKVESVSEEGTNNEITLSNLGSKSVSEETKEPHAVDRYFILNGPINMNFLQALYAQTDTALLIVEWNLLSPIPDRSIQLLGPPFIPTKKGYWKLWLIKKLVAVKKSLR